MNKVVVTTSWDDGHRLDIDLSKLLKKYHINGTFYISPLDREIKPEDRLTIEQILELSENFEIGAHTMTHPVITNLENDIIKKEIVDSKKYLENILNKEVISFCYPGGYFNRKDKEIIREAGFKFARTVKRYSYDVGFDNLEVPTTIHTYRHWSDLFLILKETGLSKFIKCYFNWDELAIIMFDKVMKNGGIFHLWGHSWEIDKNDDWERLERVLKYISNKEGVQYLNNSELI